MIRTVSSIYSGPCDTSSRVTKFQVARTLSLLAALACALFASASSVADDRGEARKPLAGLTSNCTDCGVVRNIREIRSEREAQRPDAYISSPQYRDTLPAEPPRIGPAISMTWGPGTPPRTQIGAVGTPGMQRRYIDLTYEVTVRFDDGRFGLIEQDSINDLRVGDRVIVLNRRVEKLGQ
jgi:hypothetical protein